jgi:hypothetical protein
VRDYIGATFAKKGDKLDFGVKGMKWGVRRDRATLRKEAAKRSTSTSTSTTEKKPATNPDGSETSATRYARLQAQAKAGKGSDMTEADLKFFNARTEALAKVNKMTEEEPSWLSKTAKKVIQQTAERQMQGISDTLADKYIGAPIKDAIKGKPPSKDDKATD